MSVTMFPFHLDRFLFPINHDLLTDIIIAQPHDRYEIVSIAKGARIRAAIIVTSITD